MAKRLKLKLSRVIPSIHFCRSKHPSTSAETPLPALCRLSPFNPKAFDITYPNLPAPPPSTPEYSFNNRHVSPKVASVGCGCLSKSCIKYSYSYRGIKSPDYTRKKEAAAAPPCDVVNNSKTHEPKHQTKLYDVSSEGGISPVWVNEKYKKKQRNQKEKKTKASVSSRYSGFFSSEEEEEYKDTDTLLSSSRSFSNDSSFEIDDSLETTSHDFYSSESTKPTKKKANTNINTKKIRRLKRYASKNYKGSDNTTMLYPELESPVKASVLRRMIPCRVEGKVRESVAVVKKSVDPYEDFKRSMLEMIMEKEMFEAKDLEELLQCFLSLNSRQYHRIIVDAFSEIWEVLFCDCPVEGQMV